MRTRQNGGFALLLVLAILIIAGAVLASLARKSCQLALQASMAQEKLQLEWGCASCRAIVLPAAELLLAESAWEGQPPAAVAARSVTLGGMKFDATLWDEQCKLNANWLAQHRGNDVESSLLAVQAGLVGSRNLQLRPIKSKSGAADESSPPYVSYEQIFTFEDPGELFAQTDPNESPLARITCWGDGKVNFKRAAMPVVREASRDLLDESQLDKLRRLREQTPTCTMSDLMKTLQLPQEKWQALTESLTDLSDCYGLWIVACGKTRNWRQFCVLEGPFASGAGFRKYEW